MNFFRKESLQAQKYVGNTVEHIKLPICFQGNNRGGSTGYLCIVGDRNFQPRNFPPLCFPPVFSLPEHSPLRLGQVKTIGGETSGGEKPQGWKLTGVKIPRGDTSGDEKPQGGGKPGVEKTGGKHRGGNLRGERPQNHIVTCGLLEWQLAWPAWQKAATSRASPTLVRKANI